ncbi:MAG: hypothetical protein QOI66_4244 [Myxococcales bacterium]|jgi:hypothetical protein|nr:hypothetical protein [Myxococcales bacterium]
MSLVARDLRTKHRLMRSSPFVFMRASFYRWCQLWPALAPDERATWSVMAVGDLHVENFGTWRDSDGRLVWGVNDPMMRVVGPWLVRRLAPHCTRISLGDLPAERDEERLLYAMGFETANIHLGTPHAGRRIAEQLQQRPVRWLRETTKTMVAALEQDYAEY